jgi:hypothetical protein
MVVTTVDEMVAAYQTEGPEADKRFAGKMLKVTGIVDRIEIKEALNRHYIMLTGKTEAIGQEVRCTFDASQSAIIQKLYKGSTVTIAGKYDGSIIDMSLRDCTLAG